MIKKMLKSPVTLFISVVLGVVLGVYLPNVITFLTFFNNVYVSLVKLVSVPIMICIITLNISKVVNGEIKKELGFLLVVLIIFLVGAFFLCAIVCFGFKGGNGQNDDRIVTLIKMNSVGNEEMVSDGFEKIFIFEENDADDENGMSFRDFIKDNIPENIFLSILNNNVIEILVFFSIFGIMLNMVDKKRSKSLLKAFDGFYELLYKFFNDILLFAGFSLMVQIGTVLIDEDSIKLVPVVMDLMLMMLICLTMVIMISFVIIKRATGCGIREGLEALKRVFVVSVSTSSRNATIPVVISDFKMIKKDLLESIMPINVLLCPLGMLVRVAVVGIYIYFIYNHSMGINIVTMGMMLVLVIFFSISISSIPAIISATMLPILFEPLGLPSDIAAVIWIVVNIFYLGLETFCTVYVNVAIISIIDYRLKRYDIRDKKFELPKS